MKRQPIKVLIVAKYAVIRAGLRAMLKAQDIRVVAQAGTADEALRLAGARSVDLVLAHVRIDEAAAVDLLCRIKDSRPEVSIVILTGSDDPVSLSKALASGCSGYLHENVDRVGLLKAVRAVARGECVVEPTLLQSLLKDLARKPDDRQAVRAVPLTVPEQGVLRLITEGGTNREIAQRLGYSLGTVKEYVQRIIEKLEVSDRTQAAVKALRLGLVN